MAETKTRKKKRRKKNYLLRIILFLAFVAGVYFLMSSSLFYVESFEITGNDHFTDSMATDICGIKTGKNIFFETDLKTARYNLLSSPYVRVAKIKRKLPKTIVIEIEEREEFAAAKVPQGIAIVDKDGLVLRISDAEPYLPLISGMQVISAEPGKPLETEPSYLFSKSLDLLEEASVIDFYFERIDISMSSVKAYIYYDQYLCEGTLDNLIASLSSIKVMVASQYSQDISHGTIYVGSNGYLSYAP